MIMSVVIIVITIQILLLMTTIVTTVRVGVERTIRNITLVKMRTTIPASNGNNSKKRIIITAW